MSMVTCLDCGYSEKHKIEEDPKYDTHDCPHEDLDRRGSNKSTVMFYCKQCCTHVDARDRADVEKLDIVRNKLPMASTVQQQLASKILDEQELNGEQVVKCFALYRELVQDYVQDHEKITSTTLKALLEDSYQ